MAKSYYYREDYYYDGNAVRRYQAEAEPSYEPEVERPERKRQTDPERQKRIQKNRERHEAVDLKFTAVIAVCMGFILLCGAGYLQEKARITSTQNKISSLQSELALITNQNVAKEEQLKSSVDLKSVYEKAVKKLGMKYADADHTVLYDSADPDYVRQYRSIPEDK